MRLNVTHLCGEKLQDTGRDKGIGPKFTCWFRIFDKQLCYF